jgi:competence protein ComEC
LPEQFRLLWPGDIEAVTEKRLLHKSIGKVDAMLMPHHGSSTSSQPAFVRGLMPSLAVAQTGFANHYGFPVAEVVGRYKAVGAEVRNTANGAVVVHWLQPGAAPEIRQWQEEAGSRRTIALGVQ